MTDPVRVAAHVGSALLLVQLCEQVIGLALQLCLPAKDYLSVTDLERAEKEIRKKTLGQLIGTLHKRTDIDEGFEDRLSTFLDRRNTLVHRAIEIPSCGLATEEGESAVIEYAFLVMEDAIYVRNVFLGLLRTWQEQNGIDIPVPDEARRFHERIDKDFKLIVNEIFYRKSPSSG